MTNNPDAVELMTERPRTHTHTHTHTHIITDYINKHKTADDVHRLIHLAAHMKTPKTHTHTHTTCINSSAMYLYWSCQISD